MSGGEGGDPTRAGSGSSAGRGRGEPKPEVLSSLPRRRPGRRSPRRDEAAAARVRASGHPSSRGTTEEGHVRRAGGPSVESLARAGVSIAVGAVSTGARLSGRALGALRGVIERR